jgi:hypothetical protein
MAIEKMLHDAIIRYDEHAPDHISRPNSAVEVDEEAGMAEDLQ